MYISMEVTCWRWAFRQAIGVCSSCFCIANQLVDMSATPTSDPEKKVEVFDEDDAVLAQLGYTQGK